mmetsp:Transcript_2243/g.4491  ORF Transcript_2243/g.4491 Transcript_2243/m.4491 type:complete len:116 (+) Transcript_2243:34-381(+)|eukprot:scaffold132_cov170-Amphora_coffeaeformis.AAC.43
MKQRGAAADVEMSSSESLHKHGTPETLTSEENEETNTSAPTPKDNKPTIQLVGWSDLSRHEKYDLVGWILFVFSAVFYLVAAVEFESLTSILGSLFFLVACFAFLIPMLWKEKQS